MSLTGQTLKNPVIFINVFDRADIKKPGNFHHLSRGV